MVLFVILILFVAIYGLNKARSSNQHMTKPKTEHNPDFNPEEFIDSIKASPYYQDLQPLNNFVSGKVVQNSIAGNSGFILLFENGEWASAYREGDVVGASFGALEPSSEIKGLINNRMYGHAAEPIAENTIYADEFCDIPKEVLKSHGNKINGLSFGKGSFNFAFENGFELDVKLVNDKTGTPAFRVFWEQW